MTNVRRTLRRHAAHAPANGKLAPLSGHGHVYVDLNPGTGASPRETRSRVAPALRVAAKRPAKARSRGGSCRELSLSNSGVRARRARGQSLRPHDVPRDRSETRTPNADPWRGAT